MLATGDNTLWAVCTNGDSAGSTHQAEFNVSSVSKGGRKGLTERFWWPLNSFFAFRIACEKSCYGVFEVDKNSLWNELNIQKRGCMSRRRNHNIWISGALMI
jgi:hypothetical protein